MKQINWGVLGTAGIAEKQTIPGMQQAQNCRLYAIAGRSLEKAQDFQTRFGFEKAYGSYEELLADPKVEAVYIPLPNDLHREWALRALHAKKHVLCEKPLCPTAAQAEELIHAAQENGVYLMEAFAYLHSPFIAAVKAEVDSGVIGKPVYIDSAFITPTPALENIRMRRDTFGGALYDLGCYNTSMVLWLMGKEPEDVQASAHFTPQGVDIHTTALLRFEGGCRASIQCGMVLCPEAGQRIDRLLIHGTKGSITSDAPFNGCGELTYTVHANGRDEVQTVSVPHNYQLEVEQLGRCITNGETPFVSNEFTMLNARVMDAVLAGMGYC